MVRVPVPGAAKTRLRLPSEKAAELQTALVRDTVGRACSLDLGPVVVFGTPPEKLSLLEPLLPEGVTLLPQSEGDLGEKMHAAASGRRKKGARISIRAPG